jgi:hypothetical protein
MEENADPNKPPAEPPTPEVAQLLKMLEFQANARRQRHAPAPSPFQTDSFRYGILIAIVVFALGSLGVLEWLLSQIPKPAHPAGAVPSALSTPAGGQ